MKLIFALILVLFFQSNTYAGTVVMTGADGVLYTVEEDGDESPKPKKEETEAGICINCDNTNKLLTDKALQNFTDIKKAGSAAFENTFLLDPMLVEQTDSRVLAEMLMERLQGLCGKYRDPKGKKMDDESSEIIMLVPGKYLESIANSGFKNQHQTSKTNGSDFKSMRLSAEEQHILMGLPYTNKARELLPKYALQVFHDGKLETHRVPFQYGNVLIRFKPEIKKRASWSPQDSLSVEAPLNTNSTKAKVKACDTYCEAQIWGDLDMSDVASIVVSEGTEVSDSMKKMGIPIHSYQRDNDRYYETEGDPYAAKPGKKNPKRKISDTGTLLGIEVSGKPIFSPSAPFKKSSSSSLSIEEERKLLNSEKNEVQKNLIRSRILGKTSTQDLIKSYTETYSKETENIAKVKSKGSDFYANYGENNPLNQERVRMLAEIGAREKTPEVTELLLKAFENEVDDGKAVALSGLSHLPFEKLKPLLLSGINQSKKDDYNKTFLERTVMLMSMPYSQDKDIKKAISKDPFFKKEMDKFHNGDFCSKSDSVY